MIGSVTIAGREVAVTLPRMAWRLRVMGACGTLGEKPSTVDFAALCCAAIGLCWSGPGAPLSRFELLGRDPIRYGEAVLEELMASGVPLADVFEPGRLLIDQIVASMPREEAVEAAAGPSGVTKGAPTPSSSPSASSGSVTPSTSTG